MRLVQCWRTKGLSIKAVCIFDDLRLQDFVWLPPYVFDIGGKVRFGPRAAIRDQSQQGRLLAVPDQLGP